MSEDTLKQLLRQTQQMVEQRRAQVPLNGVKALASMQPRPLDLSSLLREDEQVCLIVQIKQTAPDMEDAVENYDPVVLAKRFEFSGVKAISVATNPEYHRGDIADLTLVSQNVAIPVLRQDFIYDEYQVVEARAAGADGLMLTVGLVNPEKLRELISLTQRYRMTEIVQVETEEEVRTAIQFEPRVIAISNRDLRDLTIDLDRTLRLRELIPPHMSVISVGGLRTAEDVATVYQANIDGILVGQALLTAPDKAKAIKELFRTTASLNSVSS